MWPVDSSKITFRAQKQSFLTSLLCWKPFNYLVHLYNFNRLLLNYSPAITKCTSFHSLSVIIFLSQSNDSMARFRFFFLSYRFIDKNTNLAVGGIRSWSSSSVIGVSNDEKFNEGYKTRGRLLRRLVNVDKNVSAVKLLFTRTVSAMPVTEIKYSTFSLATSLPHKHCIKTIPKSCFIFLLWNFIPFP